MTSGATFVYQNKNNKVYDSEKDNVCKLFGIQSVRWLKLNKNNEKLLLTSSESKINLGQLLDWNEAMCSFHIVLNSTSEICLCKECAYIIDDAIILHILIYNPGFHWILINSYAHCSVTSWYVSVSLKNVWNIVNLWSGIIISFFE